jgi:lysyl-tRNA synthetase class 2
MLYPERLIPLRNRFLRTVRDWFDSAGFDAVETPIIVASPGMEPHLQAFATSAEETPEGHRQAYLRTSPEYHMKRMLANHSKAIYQICRCFRDEPASRLHHPEFTMLEWYRRDADYTALMTDCDNLLSTLADLFFDGGPLRIPEGDIDLSGPCERLSVDQAFRRYTGLNLSKHESAESLAGAAVKAGFEVGLDWPWEDIFHFVLIEAIEPRLGTDRPLILYGYPASLAALSRIVDGKAERFELYIAGHELANAFSELVDPVEQRARFEHEQALRRTLGRPLYPIDENLLDALAQLPPSTGIALGLDRLWLLFAEHALERRLNLTDVLSLAL